MAKQACTCVYNARVLKIFSWEDVRRPGLVLEGNRAESDESDHLPNAAHFLSGFNTNGACFDKFTSRDRATTKAERRRGWGTAFLHVRGGRVSLLSSIVYLPVWQARLIGIAAPR